MEKQFHIKGMSCGHCVAAVEKELNRLELKKKEIVIGSVTIEFDPAKVSEREIFKAIEAAGFAVSV
ncbi:heavy-metal-associated domain-containing protein [Bacteroidota bacterium]